MPSLVASGGSGPLPSTAFTRGSTASDRRLRQGCRLSRRRAPSCSPPCSRALRSATSNPLADASEPARRVCNDVDRKLADKLSPIEHDPFLIVSTLRRYWATSSLAMPGTEVTRRFTMGTICRGSLCIASRYSRIVLPASGHKARRAREMCWCRCGAFGIPKRKGNSR